MSPTYRRARTALVAALSLSLLTACPLPQNPKAVADPDIGNGPNCVGGKRDTSTWRREQYDINDDGTPDLFYVYRCHSPADGGDQVEVFDGTNGKHLNDDTSYLLHRSKGITVGCLMLSGATVFIIGRKTPKSGWTLQETASWNGRGFTMTTEAGMLPMPCAKRRDFPRK